MAHDPNEKQERTRKVGRGRQPVHMASWSEASPDLVVKAIEAACSVGGAIRFGYSRDGGAFAVGIYGDGEPYTDFISGVEKIDDYLEDYIALYDDIRSQGVITPKAKKRAAQGTSDAK